MEKTSQIFSVLWFHCKATDFPYKQTSKLTNKKKRQLSRFQIFLEVIFPQSPRSLKHIFYVIIFIPSTTECQWPTSAEGRVYRKLDRRAKGKFRHWMSFAQRGSPSQYGLLYSKNFCLHQVFFICKIISSEILFIDYTGFQNTFSLKVFLDYIRILKEEQKEQTTI